MIFFVATASSEGKILLYLSLPAALAALCVFMQPAPVHSVKNKITSINLVIDKSSSFVFDSSTPISRAETVFIKAGQ